MSASLDSPEKQELGRRIFGGLPASSPLSSKKGPVSKPAQPDLPSPTGLYGATPQNRLAESSNGAGPAAAADPLSGTSHAPLLARLQQQAQEAAVMGGVPVEQVADSLSEPTPDMPQALRGPENMQAAFARLRQLSEAAAAPARELQMSISKHAARQLPESKTKTESTALVVPPPPQTSQSWPSKNRHLQAAPLLQQGASASRRQPQAITCMLERLQLLQQEGVHFAGFL